jgi:hypothetical protein
MRHAAGNATDGLHLLRLQKFRFHLNLVGHVDETDYGSDEIAILDDRPAEKLHRYDEFIFAAENTRCTLHGLTLKQAEIY